MLGVCSRSWIKAVEIYRSGLGSCWFMAERIVFAWTSPVPNGTKVSGNVKQIYTRTTNLMVVEPHQL